MPGSITVARARRCRLRVGSVADAECVAGLAQLVFLDTYAADGMRADLAREALAVCSAARFAAALSDQQQRLALAECDGLLLGFAQLALQPAAVSGDLPPGLELIRLYVHPAHQRCGLGRMLLADAEGQARSAGLGLWLSAWAGNTRALDFYRALGFRDVGARPYVFEANTYENRLLYKSAGHIAGSSRERRQG